MPSAPDLLASITSEIGLPFEFVYAAALALLVKQLRERAPMSDVLQSVGRLTTLAHVGRVTITTAHLEAPPTAAMAEAVAVLCAAMQEHRLASMEIAGTVTDTEFLRLAALLTGGPATAGGIVAAATAQSIWNVRLREQGAPRAAPAPEPLLARAGARSAAAPPPAAAPLQPEQELAVQQAVIAGDGAAVCRALIHIADPAQFQRVATPVALQLATEWLVEDRAAYAEVQPLLERAGVAGARAVFEQLVAASDMTERRLLYDTAAGLPSTIEVARQYLADPTWYVVRNAAGLLGESRHPDAVPDLSKLLRHADERVRVAAVVALGQIGGPVAIARLESVLLDPSPEVRNRALALVFASPDGEALQSRVAALHDDESTVEVQLETIAALAHVRTPRARHRLEAICLDAGRGIDKSAVRLAAMQALAAGHRPDADATLRSLLDDPSGSIRERAAALLA